MQVLLISTYELGRQPIHVASPAAALRDEGHEVSVVDLAVDQLTVEKIDWAEAVAVSVPMHTAMRLAISTASQIRDLRPRLPIAFYGLYAGVGVEHTMGSVADRFISGEYESALVEWLETGATGDTTHLAKTRFVTPDRTSLPPLSSYARLEWQGEARLAGAVEASHGCRHRCRHCPIPAVYDGRWRPVGEEPVLEDISRLVSMGARHITFGDPDFLNAPRYSLDILGRAHAAHPGLTFDLTIKVEHILDHEETVEEMGDLGVLFIVSAFESVDDRTLDILDKGHTVSDMRKAIDIVRGAAMHLRPTWLPFFPWTTKSDIAHLVDFLDENRLWEATDPVQLAIKLLIPEGSLLESHSAVQPHLLGYEPSTLTWDWAFEDPGVALLHKQLDAMAAEASDCGDEALDTLEAMRRIIGVGTGTRFGEMPIGRAVPKLTESWYCCSEPTDAQIVSISLPTVQSR